MQNHVLKEKFANAGESNSIFKENLKVVSIYVKFERELGQSEMFQAAEFEFSHTNYGKNDAYRLPDQFPPSPQLVRAHISYIFTLF